MIFHFEFFNNPFLIWLIFPSLVMHLYMNEKRLKMELFFILFFRLNALVVDCFALVGAHQHDVIK